MQLTLFLFYGVAVVFVLCLLMALARAWGKRRGDRESRFRRYYQSHEPLEDGAFLEALELVDEEAAVTALEVRRLTGEWAGIPRRRIWPESDLRELGELGVGGDPAALHLLVHQRLELPVEATANAAIGTVADLVYATLARQRSGAAAGERSAAGA